MHVSSHSRPPTLLHGITRQFCAVKQTDAGPGEEKGAEMFQYRHLETAYDIFSVALHGGLVTIDVCARISWHVLRRIDTCFTSLLID